MQLISESGENKSRVKLGLLFAVHQFIGVWVVVRSAPILTATAFNLLRSLGRPYPTSYYSWILSGTPYFPVQIGLGLLLGWLLGWNLRHRSMIWVWLLPFAFLCYAFIAIPTLTPRITPLAFQAGIGESRLWHYFGWGCQPVNHCIDQESITSPFYTSAAYSIAGLLALKTVARARPAAKKQFGILLVVGIIFLGAAIYDLVVSLQIGGWIWMLFPVEAVPAGMGALLILLAFSVRHWQRPVV
jgi:hypothetical protein